MTRDEFKVHITSLIDEIVPTNRELEEEDENNLNDGIDVAEILASEDDDSEPEEVKES